MARAPRDYRLETPGARAKLKLRKEPYWRQIVPGTFLGLYRGARGDAWIVRQRVGEGYEAQRLGMTDDNAQADGDAVLSYAQACQRATEIRLAERKPAPAPRHLADGMTVNATVEYYVDEHLHGKPSGPIAKQLAALHIAPTIGKKLVTSLRAEDYRRWLRALADKPPTNRGKVLKVDMTDPDVIRSRRHTANRIWTILRAALQYAWSNDKLPGVTPEWQKVTPLDTGQDPAPRMLDRAEITRLINACPADFRQLVTAGLMTGGRYSELTGLKVGDFDADNECVRIHQTKNGKVLQQPLTPEGVRFFEAVTAGRHPTDRMFLRADGESWNANHQARPMREAAAKAKIEGVSFKVTRATYGKLLLIDSKDIELVAKSLGHSDSRITRKHYAQYLPSELATAMKKMKSLGIVEKSKVSRIGKKAARPGA